MSDEWLTPRQAATQLSCSVETIRSILRDGLLSGKKMNGQWRVRAYEVEILGTIKGSEKPPRTSPPISSEVNPGLIEVSVALAAIATAIAAILPGISGASETFRLATAIMAGVLAVLSAYSALWLLACYRIGPGSVFGLREIWKLLFSPDPVKPYSLMAWALVVWLALSALIGALAIL
jgi:excisionase family DNA binding protein